MKINKINNKKGGVMNQFQKNIILKTHDITMYDFRDFTEASESKIRNRGLPTANCRINKYNKREYCLKNCGLKCAI